MAAHGILRHGISVCVCSMWVRCSSCFLIAYRPSPKGGSEGWWSPWHYQALVSTPQNIRVLSRLVTSLKRTTIQTMMKEINSIPAKYSTYDKTAARKGSMIFHNVSFYLCIVLSNVLASTSSKYCRGIIMQRCRSSILPHIEEYALLNVPMPGLNLSTAALHNTTF